jgi:hypothetical protein
VTVWSTATRGIYRECDAWRTAVFDKLANSKPALVIVSNLVDAAESYVDRRSGAVLHGVPARAEFRAGLERTLRRLRELGVAVVLIRDTPRPRADIIECLYSSPESQRCERPRAQALEAHALDAAIALASGIPVWDFSDEICDPVSCPVIMPRERRSIYRDDNHLSASFVSSLAPAVRARWPSGIGPGR